MISLSALTLFFTRSELPDELKTMGDNVAVSLQDRHDEPYPPQVSNNLSPPQDLLTSVYTRLTYVYACQWLIHVYT